MRKWLLLIMAGGLLVVAAMLVVAQRPGELGLVNGALRHCSGGAACVNSQLGEQRIAPLYVGEEVGRAWLELVSLLEGNSSVTVTAVESHYLRAEWVQSIFPFPNDIEFLRFDSGGMIHVRSEGRIGFMTFGSHRSQIDGLVRSLAEALGSADGS
ncbi:MAG: DUF1499 domain-containing protein [bacterium]|nr:DUF1499 domain-containing protein [bacterium]